MSKLILHTAHYEGLPWEILQSVIPKDFEVRTLPKATTEDLIREAKDADYLLVSGRLPIDKSVLKIATKLKMIQRTGVGTEMLDLDAIRERNIPVYVNQGVNARSVAEHTMLMIFSCLKNLPKISFDVKSGVWKKQQVGVCCNMLYGKTIGLIGMGNIGKLVAEMLMPFGVKVFYSDIRRMSEADEIRYGVNYCTFESLLRKVDILSLHCPLTEDNKEIINKETLAVMKRGAMIVNTARGKLINERDLYNALVSGQIKTAALDVHYEEPILVEDPLISLDNVILSPHIAGLSYEAFRDMMREAVDNIVAFDNGEYDKIENKKLEK